MKLQEKHEKNIHIENVFEMVVDLYKGLMKNFPDLIVILDLSGEIINISDTVDIFYKSKKKKIF